MKQIIIVFICLALIVGLAACGGGDFSNFRDSDLGTDGEHSEIGLGTAASTEYELGAGDQLRLIVFGEEDLSGEFLVDGSGYVSLPLIGEVQAENHTVREFQQAVEEELRGGFLNEPRVSAEVLNFRPFYIMGEVETPGEYPYTDGLTVLKAVATAEGFTFRANTRRVFIKRAGEEGEIEAPLTTETQVFPGDTVRIVERFF